MVTHSLNAGDRETFSLTTQLTVKEECELAALIKDVIL